MINAKQESKSCTFSVHLNNPAGENIRQSVLGAYVLIIPSSTNCVRKIKILNNKETKKNIHRVVSYIFHYFL